jgi:hypothetical protein
MGGGQVSNTAPQIGSRVRGTLSQSADPTREPPVCMCRGHERSMNPPPAAGDVGLDRLTLPERPALRTRLATRSTLATSRAGRDTIVVRRSVCCYAVAFCDCVNDVLKCGEIPKQSRIAVEEVHHEERFAGRPVKEEHIGHLSGDLRSLFSRHSGLDGHALAPGRWAGSVRRASWGQ